MDEEWYKRWLKSMVWEAKKAVHAWGFSENIPDVESVVAEALWKFAVKHPEDYKTARYSFLRTVVRRRMYDFLRDFHGHEHHSEEASNRIKHINKVQIMEDWDPEVDPYASDGDISDMLDDIAFQEAIDYVKAQVDDRTWDAMTAHLRGETYEQVAERWGVTPSMISHVRTAARKKYMKRFRTIMEG